MLLPRLIKQLILLAIYLINSKMPNNACLRTADAAAKLNRYAAKLETTIMKIILAALLFLLTTPNLAVSKCVNNSAYQSLILVQSCEDKNGLSLVRAKILRSTRDDKKDIPKNLLDALVRTPKVGSSYVLHGWPDLIEGKQQFCEKYPAGSKVEVYLRCPCYDYEMPKQKADFIIETVFSGNK